MRIPRVLKIAVALLIGLLVPQFARGSLIGYNVTHNFTFSPSGGIVSAPTYVFGVSATASPGGIPSTQNGAVTFTTAGGTSSQQATSTGGLSSATANSSATVNPFTLGGPISGTIDSDGSIVVLPGGTCCAISSAAIVLTGGTGAAHGSAGWTEDMGMEGDGGGVTEGETAKDPIDFHVTDLLTGLVTDGTLFTVSSDLEHGTWTWNGGTFALNASDFDFSIAIDSPFTVQQGTANLQVRNGVITVSSGTGMFAGLFPSVGGAGNFSVPFGSSFALDYNLGSFNGDPLAVTFTLGDSGSSCTIPEPSSAGLSGLAALLLILMRHARSVSI